jgi:Family of unknown function (DUF6527)
MKINFFGNLFRKREKPDFTNLVYVESLADIPNQTGLTIYVVSNYGKHKWVVFECPNHCGKRVEVNLMRSRYPHWYMNIRKGKVSLSPSIVVENCGAHFFLTKNRIIEVKFT